MIKMKPFFSNSFQLHFFFQIVNRKNRNITCFKRSELGLQTSIIFIDNSHPQNYPIFWALFSLVLWISDVSREMDEFNSQFIWTVFCPDNEDIYVGQVKVSRRYSGVSLNKSLWKASATETFKYDPLTKTK